MFSVAQILLGLTPIPILTALVAGILVGFIYVSRIGDFNKAFGYHNVILAAAFFVSLTTTGFFIGFGWEQWIIGLILYIIYMTGVWIGKIINR